MPPSFERIDFPCGGCERRQRVLLQSQRTEHCRSLAAYDEQWWFAERIQGRSSIARRRTADARLRSADPGCASGVITKENASKIKAKSIIEGANGPVFPDADKILEERGITVLPDILANAGGVTVSYFEWVQNRQHYSWSLDRVRQELDRTLSEAFEQVWTESQRQTYRCAPPHS